MLALVFLVQYLRHFKEIESHNVHAWPFLDTVQCKEGQLCNGGNRNWDSREGKGEKRKRKAVNGRRQTRL